jgi:hypothetical protein
MAAGVAPWDAIIREGKSKVGPGVTDVAPADDV